MNDMTALESADGHTYLAELDEAAATIAFIDGDTDQPIATFTLDTLATVTDALSLDLTTARYLDDVSVANIRQWARI